MKPLLSALAWTLLFLMVDIGTASSQQGGRVYRIGWLWIGRPGLVLPPMETWSGTDAAFPDALRDRGYVLGKNLIVDARHAHGDVARLATEAESLVANGVDLIVTVGTTPTSAAIRATNRVPIVFVAAHDPVGKGLVASLARPGGNVTGMAVQLTELKMYQLLRDISQATPRVGLVTYAPSVPDQYLPLAAARARATAKAVGIELIGLSVNARDELEPKFAELADGGDGAIIITSDSTLLLWRTSILAMALRYRLVTVCDLLEWAEAGCLITYADDPYPRLRGAAGMIDKILKGAKPADIPVEEPTTYKLIVNAKTAKALDRTVPTSILARADEVIE
jgi:putative ABC transport system substrate-binding protein